MAATATKKKTAFDGKAAAAAITHRDGCPADAGRAESYPAVKPASDEAPRHTVFITRCQDCGAARVDSTKPAWASGIEGDA